MTFFRRFIYFIYYLKENNNRQFVRFLKYASVESGKSKMKLLADVVYSVFKYNISLSDYFHFRFYLLNMEKRFEWAGTGFLYEYQLKMNPRGSREILEDKIAFNERFNSLIKRNYASLQSLIQGVESEDKILVNQTGKVVLKNAHGQAGKQVGILECKDLDSAKLISIMKSGKYDLVEEYVEQHREMMRLSPSGLNTVRIITQSVEGEIEVLAARLRISINSPVDNLAAGNAAAPVDLTSGVVTGPAVFSDITKKNINFHPVTGVEIPGFRIPFWNEILDIAIKAATMTPENRSVGWDIAITDDGVLLIEGNHNWCKLLWQLPVKKGLKEELIKYL
jgi:hypothetical protein